MRISFLVNESFEEILNEIANSNNVWESTHHIEDNDVDVYTLTDVDFDSSATCRVKNANHSASVQRIYITTAWSRYTYEIQTSAEGVFITYDGAYRGLLSQNLLPKLTPIDLMSSEVESSLRNYDTLTEYVEAQSKLHSFKKENGFDVNYHAHPKCVHEILTGK